MRHRDKKRSNMPCRRHDLSRRLAFAGRLLVGLGVMAILLQFPMPGHAADKSQLKQSGTVEVEQTQIAFIVSGNLGGGRLHYGGRSYDFTIGGLGVGGFGASKIKATGEIYNLNNIADFPGAYGQARAGFALDTMSKGDLWLENTKGVYIHLDAKRQGYALSLGADAVFIELK